MNRNITASIIIRTFNEGLHIERLLQGIRSQKVLFTYEVILVDSGSIDDTISIAAQYRARIVSISREQFSFGASINRGVEAAQGEYCVFISGHCYPEHENWLERMIRPFSDTRVALVYGKQRGNEVTKYSEHRIFAKWFPEDGGGVQKSSFCNNANAAIRKDIWRTLRYNESITGLEDIDWAQNAIKRGYTVYYAPDAGVIHVHNERFSRIYRRYEREALAMRTIYPDETFSFFDFIKLFTLNTLSDYVHAAQDRVLLENMLKIPAMRLYQFWGTYRGYNFRKPVQEDLRYKFYYPEKPALIRRNRRTKNTLS